MVTKELWKRHHDQALPTQQKGPWMSSKLTSLFAIFLPITFLIANTEGKSEIPFNINIIIVLLLSMRSIIECVIKSKNKKVIKINSNENT